MIYVIYDDQEIIDVLEPPEWETDVIRNPQAMNLIDSRQKEFVELYGNNAQKMRIKLKKDGIELPSGFTTYVSSDVKAMYFSAWLKQKCNWQSVCCEEFEF